MIDINNKSASIKHNANTVLEKAEILKTARLNKKQKEALHVIINLTGAIQEDAEAINEKLTEVVMKALSEQTHEVGEGEEAF